MKTKKITITVKESNLIVSSKLKPPADVELNIEGFEQLEAMQVIIGLLGTLFNNYKEEIDRLTADYADKARLNKFD